MCNISRQKRKFVKTKKIYFSSIQFLKNIIGQIKLIFDFIQILREYIW